MLKFIKIAGLGLAVLTGAKMTYVELKMENFRPGEFGASLPFLSFGLLSTLQLFRDLVQAAVIFSAAETGGLMRFGTGTSQHFFGRAIDIQWPQGVDRNVCFALAKQAGFTGIGVYSWGMHLDTRPGSLKTWGRIYDNGTHTDISADQWLEQFA